MYILLLALLALPLPLHGMEHKGEAKASTKAVPAHAAHQSTVSLPAAAVARLRGLESLAPKDLETTKALGGAQAKPKDESKEENIYFDLTYEKFLAGYKGFMEVQKKLLSNKEEWLDNSPIKFPSEEFQAYVQKVVVPAGSSIFLLGDLHGDMNALNEFITKLRGDGILSSEGKIIAANTYIIFAGDYTDRGPNGAEVLATLLHLKMNNPTQVLMARGNHESVDQNKSGDVCLYEEFKKKFGDKAEAAFALLPALYNSLPAAILIGTANADDVVNYMLCCHGTPEVRHDLQPFLASKYQYARIIKNDLPTVLAALTEQQESNYYFSDKPSDGTFIVLADKLNQKEFTEAIDYLWGDLQADPKKGTQMTTDNPDRGCALTLRYGERLIRGLMQIFSSEKAHIKAIFRAHQHNDTHPTLCDPENHGCARQPWESPVFTTIGAPGIINMPVICCALEITTHASFDQWQMTQHYLELLGKNLTWTADTLRLTRWKNDFDPEWQDGATEDEPS